MGRIPSCSFRSLRFWATPAAREGYSSVASAQSSHPGCAGSNPGSAITVMRSRHCLCSCARRRGRGAVTAVTSSCDRRTGGCTTLGAWRPSWDAQRHATVGSAGCCVPAGWLAGWLWYACTHPIHGQSRIACASSRPRIHPTQHIRPRQPGRAVVQRLALSLAIPGARVQNPAVQLQ